MTGDDLMLKEIKVDTLHLVAKLSTEDMEEVMNLIDFNLWKGNATYMHILSSKEPFFIIYVKPRFGTWLYTKEPYNIMIHMQRDAVCQKPAILRQLLNIGIWKVKRLDIACDWLIPMSKQFLLRNANVVIKTFQGNDNYYLYGERNQARAVVYDKKRQLLEKKGITIEEEALTRLELRIRPLLKKQTTMKELSWLKQQLDKFVFLSDVSMVSRQLTKQEDKVAFRAVRRRQGKDWIGIGERQKQRIRKVIKENAVDLYKLFVESGSVDEVNWNDD